ncbi:PH domain-containing protein [Micromonospora sp. CMU55-4]|uniref:PH domain-containing protein n=1 Tax=Micromonospora sp. CMU55-4 TaxID=2717028 RepID=UPI00140DD7DB|nr:PH domain-containing protein [Micromonospora sp. CMU55-4]NHO84862.1 PH domain-containing protein [Micromonospora sp. CMU55-4]
MIDAILAAVVRHRRPTLVTGLLVAGGNAAAMGYAPNVARATALPLLLLALALLLLAVISMGTRPAALMVLPRDVAFASPVPAWRVLLTLGLLGQSSATVGAYLRSTEAGIATTFDVGVGLLWFLLIALLVAAAWRGHSVRLSPDGVRTTGLLGSRMIPWEAGARVEAPSNDRRSTMRLPLTIANPALVRRRGLVGRPAIPVDGVQPGFLASVIGQYVAHPDHRAAIGTPDEYRRLVADLHGRAG